MGTVIEDGLNLLIQTRARRLAESCERLAKSLDNTGIAENALRSFDQFIRREFEDLRKALSIVEVRLDLPMVVCPYCEALRDGKRAQPCPHGHPAVVA